MKTFIQLNPKDDVIVLLQESAKGTVIEVDGRPYTLLQDIPAGHKMAIKPIAEGQNILKYGYPIGVATTAIAVGEHIHTHNIKTGLSGTLTYEYHPKTGNQAKGNDARTFKGYLRKNGNAGIRNELWIVPTVGCVNGQAEQMIRRFKEEVNPSDIDAVEVFKILIGYPVCLCCLL